MHQRWRLYVRQPQKFLEHGDLRKTGTLLLAWITAAVLICVPFSGFGDLGLRNKELICFGPAELLQVQR